MKPTYRKLHKYIGIIMLAPLVLWAITGFIFLTKPFYSGAYAQLSPKLYPIEKSITLPNNKNWTQVKLLRSTLGYHLLAKVNNQWQHLNSETFKPMPRPSKQQIAILF